jgi:hypothetical protein
MVLMGIDVSILKLVMLGLKWRRPSTLVDLRPNMNMDRVFFLFHTRIIPKQNSKHLLKSRQNLQSTSQKHHLLTSCESPYILEGEFNGGGA